jgi:dethiobiotin synthetase
MGTIVFVTGTDTGVGKSLLTALLVRLARNSGVSALAIKPFATGDLSDARMLQMAQDGALTLEEITPFLFKKPVAPLVAARLEGRRISRTAVLRNIRRIQARCEVLFVEGCGGLLVPLGRDFTVLDLIKELQCNPLVVAADRLGTVNHTLLTVNVLQSRGIRPLGVLLSKVGVKDSSTGGNGAVLSEFLGTIPVFEIPFFGKKAGKKPHFSWVCKICAKFLKKPLVLCGVSGSFTTVRPSGGEKRSVTEKKFHKTVDGYAIEVRVATL